jgi:hypothetical protein
VTRKRPRAPSQQQRQVRIAKRLDGPLERTARETGEPLQAVVEWGVEAIAVPPASVVVVDRDRASVLQVVRHGPDGSAGVELQDEAGGRQRFASWGQCLMWLRDRAVAGAGVYVPLARPRVTPTRAG